MESEAQARKATRRERELERRRQEIMSAARTLFVEKGLRSTTLDEIAEASAYGKGTIYNYFTSKDDLFLAIIHQLIDETLTATEAAMREAPAGARAKLLAYARTALTHFHANDEVFLMIIREHNQLDSKMIQQFVDRFEEKLSLVAEPLAADVQAGRLRNVNPRILAVLFDGMIRTYCMTMTSGVWPGDGQASDDIAALMVSTFFDGIEN